MSWYSDKERYNERPDPSHCYRCKRANVSKEVCDRCARRHEEEDEEEDDDNV